MNAVLKLQRWSQIVPAMRAAEYSCPLCTYHAAIQAGLELSGGWRLTPPPVYVYRRSLLSENRLYISIPGQNFKHFKSTFRHLTPHSFRSIPTLRSGIGYTSKSVSTQQYIGFRLLSVRSLLIKSRTDKATTGYTPTTVPKRLIGLQMQSGYLTSSCGNSAVWKSACHCCQLRVN